MSRLRFATLNLLNFCEPGFFWYERGDSRTYIVDPEKGIDEWAAKTGWVRDIIGDLDADIIAFQEVFAPDALQHLCREAGLENFYCETRPAHDDEDRSVFVNPTVAIASRFPASDARAIEDMLPITRQTKVDERTNFSRLPLRCTFDLPGLGDTVVYAVHFKSQGAFVDKDDIDPIEDWAERMRRFFVERVHSSVDQVTKRAAEAGAIYLEAMSDLEQDQDRPVIVLGDVNEGPESHTLLALTQSAEILFVGSTFYHDMPGEHRFRKYIHRLYDAYWLAPASQVRRPVTYADADRTNVLDYAIVSNGLHPGNPRRRGAVVRHEVFGDHFHRGPHGKLSSDHAAVVITVEPRPQQAASPVIGL